MQVQTSPNSQNITDLINSSSKPGGEPLVNQSYGIEVARLAGLPPRLLARAQAVLEDIQKRSRIQSSLAKKGKDVVADSGQLSLFGDV